MVSIRSIFGAVASFALLASVRADQLVISPSPITNPTQAFQILLQNVQGYTINNAQMSAGCTTGDDGTLVSFSAGNSLFDIDHGILLSGACSITADITVPVTNNINVNYFFYTFKDTTKTTGPFDAFSLTVNNLDANSGAQAPTVQYSVENLVNGGNNIGTRPSQTGVTVLPKGNDRIQITLTNNRPLARSSGVAIGPFVVTSTVRGDPSFVGFRNQNYQVHGSSNTVYNIISTPQMQYNALFKFLSEGKCRQGTQCFAHKGNYFSQVGVMIKDAESNVNKVQVVSGPVDEGLTVNVNGKAMQIGESLQIGSYQATLVSKFEFALESSEFSIVLQNSDMFLNQEIAIGTSLQSSIRQYMLAESTSASSAAGMLKQLPHGILGQTWQANKVYENRWKYIEGTLANYIVTEDGIFGTDFKFNRF